ncbi:MAG: DUF1413 domain-containing protein [Sedimentitalea sp.]|uniref:DUF1413 domain-containing protein n=1 Tax=Sedimentitalea sp. TaxID=2048915 RepID=UPI0032651596
MFEEYFGTIQERLRQQEPQNGFEIEHLFTKEEWQAIGDGQARQQFGRRFGTGVKNEDFPGVSRNATRVNPGGNEARYNYDPAQDEGAG